LEKLDNTVLGLIEPLDAEPGDLPELSCPIREKETLRLLVAVAAGHHGRMPPPNTALTLHQGYWDESDRAVAADIARALITHFGWSSGTPDREGLERLSYVLNGFITLADWLGSDEHAFKPRFLVRVRLWIARGRPRKPRNSKRFSRIWPSQVVPSSQVPFKTRSKSSAMRACPMGHSSSSSRMIPAPARPRLPTFWLTGSWRQEGADGVYVGLPTMATADQAFLRKEHVVEALAGQAPDVVLAHSRRHRNANAHVVPAREEATPSALAARLVHAIIEARTPGRARGQHGRSGACGGASGPACHRPPRRSLAEVAGCRRNPHLRQIHALARRSAAPAPRGPWPSCDPDVGHSASKARTQLIAAYLGSAGAQALVSQAEVLDDRTFPALTVALRVNARTEKLAQASGDREIRCRATASADEVRGWLLERLSAGKSAIWFRNTVDDAVEAWEHLQPVMLLLVCRNRSCSTPASLAAIARGSRISFSSVCRYC
jgi:CRISPR-associated endonuclease/helicase Cas3